MLSPYQVGVPSKHAQNESEKHFNSSNSNKRNINEPIRAICVQDSGPPDYKHISKHKKIGGSKQNDIINRTYTGTTRAS